VWAKRGWFGKFQFFLNYLYYFQFYNILILELITLHLLCLEDLDEDDVEINLPVGK
jgi:hypothetical protein